MEYWVLHWGALSNGCHNRKEKGINKFRLISCKKPAFYTFSRFPTFYRFVRGAFPLRSAQSCTNLSDSAYSHCVIYSKVRRHCKPARRLDSFARAWLWWSCSLHRMFQRDVPHFEVTAVSGRRRKKLFSFLFDYLDDFSWAIAWKTKMSLIYLLLSKWWTFTPRASVWPCDRRSIFSLAHTQRLPNWTPVHVACRSASTVQVIVMRVFFVFSGLTGSLEIQV